MKEPNFFLAGFPRSGTTALYEYLRAHPEVFLPKLKEPGFFASDFADRFVRTEQAYLALFEDADPSRQRVVGEGTTTYAFSREALPALMHRFPRAKVILVVRHPVEMLYSLHRYYWFLGIEDIADFGQAWQKEAERRRGRCIPAGCGDAQRLYYSEWGKVGRQVERAQATVPREQLKVIFYEDLSSEPRRVYLDVLDFLGLPDDGRREFPRVNVSRRVRWPALQGALALADRGVTRMRAMLGLSRPFGVRMRLLRWNSRPAGAGVREIAPALYRELLSCFVEDIRLLEGATGRDLSHWLDAAGARDVAGSAGAAPDNAEPAPYR